MPSFEYLFVEVTNGRVKTINGKDMPSREHTEVHVFANTMGQGGWELVGVASATSYAYTLIFKHGGKAQFIEGVPEQAALGEDQPPAAEEPVPDDVSDDVSSDDEDFLDFLDPDIESDLLNG